MQRRKFLINSVAVVWLNARAASAFEYPWKNSEMLDPAELAKQISSQPSTFSLFCVGFPVLYRAAHITGAQLAGPCSKPEGLAELKRLSGTLPREQKVVLYCGCCPFDHCPNIRPAYQTMRELGFTNLKVLDIPTNMHTDWVSKGYPTQKA